MLKKLEELLENPLICAIAKGVSLVVTGLFILLTVVALVATFFNVWWFLALIPCGIVTGVGTGIAFYLFDDF